MLRHDVEKNSKLINQLIMILISILIQSYSPENITVKLNDDASVLTVSATAAPGSTDDFKQTHKVPEGIDLDQMTSSFSSDGILVIKAPRKK